MTALSNRDGNDSRIRIVVVVDWDPEQGDCEIESISSHRSCSHRLGCGSSEGGPTGALRALADEIDNTEDRWRGIPDG